MVEAIKLVNNFKIEKVIFNCGEYNDLEKELIRILEIKEYQILFMYKKLSIDKYKL